MEDGYPQKSRTAAFLLCAFFGVLGIHRFYVGKVWTGILYLLTSGLLGIGVFVDLVRIGIGAFTDSDNNKLTEWTPLGCVVSIIGLIIAMVVGGAVGLAAILNS